MLVQVQLEVKLYFDMIKMQSILKIVDNSGGKTAKCLKILGKSSKAGARLGDIIIVSIQSLRPHYKSRVRVRVNKAEIHRGVVVQTRKANKSYDGRFISFNSNSIVLITKQGRPIGTRILTFLPRVLRTLGWSKLGTLAKGLI